MSASVKACVVQFLSGVKDSLHGILLIYSLDKQIQKKQEEKRRKWEEQRNARNSIRHEARRRQINQDGSKLQRQEPRMLGRIAMSAALSSFVWVSVWAFTMYLIPVLQYQTKVLMAATTLGDESRHAGVWGYVESGLHFVFASLWVLPLYIISKAINGVWFVDVADSVFKLLYGRPRAFPSVGAAAADFVYGISVEMIFLIQAFVVKLMPIEGIGYALYCVHICLLYSLYAFEYKWYNMGMDLKVRLDLVDQNWPYFCGFGLPLFCFTNLVSSYYPTIVSACIFSILFPMFIVSGTRASVPKQSAAMRLRIFEPSASICSSVFSSWINFKRKNLKQNRS